MSTESRSQISETEFFFSRDKDNFVLDSMLIHAWLGQLLMDAAVRYGQRQGTERPPMQEGHAQAGFIRVFGNPDEQELHRLLQSFYRFTQCDDPLAAILYRALQSLSLEHENFGDFVGPRAPDLQERPQHTTLWMRESLDRWCEWIDAVIHLQTHSQWHLAPEYFDATGTKHELAPWVPLPYASNRVATGRRTNWNRWKDWPIWQLLPQAAISRPQRPWPHPELDEAILSIWPLVKRHNWTFADIINVLSDVLTAHDAYPMVSERNLAMYCMNVLRLRKTTQGKTAKEERPVGYELAIRIYPPVPPTPVLAFDDALAASEIAATLSTNSECPWDAYSLTA
jgi:hypothetical protein